MDGAGAALAGVAPDMRAGEPQLIPQKVDEQSSILHVRGDRFSVHRQFKDGHLCTFVSNSVSKVSACAPIIVKRAGFYN
jgi:hypothetical protein